MPRPDAARPVIDAEASRPRSELEERTEPPDPERSITLAEHSQVVRGSIWYIAAVSILALGGFAYWSVATHVANADLGELAGRDLVSKAGFLFTALIFTNYATNMGLPVAVARFAPANTRSVNVLFSWALLYTAVTSLIGTLGFFAVAAYIFPDENTKPLWQYGKPFGLFLFFLLVCGQSFAVLVEVRLVAMRRWGWVVSRVLLVSFLRFPLFLIPPLRDNPIGLLVIMGGPPALSGFIGAVVLRRVTPREDRGGLLPLPREWPTALRFASVNYVGMLAAQAPQFVLPLIVSKYEPAAYGAFYLAWTITTVVFLVPHATGQTVLAEASRDLARVGRQAKLGLLVAGGITSVMAAGAFVLAKPATARFFPGPAYDLTAEVLPRMVLAGVPWAVTAILLARVRVLHQYTATVVITAGFALCTLVPATIMAASSGVPGAANAWLFGNLAAAAVAVIATFVSRSTLWSVPGNGAVAEQGEATQGSPSLASASPSRRH